MNVVDITLLVLLGGFVLAGFWFGLIHMIGSFVGLTAGAFVAGAFYAPLAKWLTPYLWQNANLANIIAFAVLFILTARLVGLLFWMVEKSFKFISVIPFLGTFNRLLGAILGLLEGTLAIGLIVYFAARFPVTAPFAAKLSDSSVAHALSNIGKILAPLLPTAVRAVQSVL